MLRESCWSVPPKEMMRRACSSQWEIRAPAWIRVVSTASSTRSLRPSLTVWAWGWRSAARLWRPTAAGCGRPRMCLTALSCNSPCRSAATRWADRRPSVATPSALREGGPYGVEQGIAVERFGEERNGAGLQRSLPCHVVAVSSQNDRGNSGAHARQASEESEAIHSGHPEIEHQTTGLLQVEGLQKGFRGRERLYTEANRSQESLEGPTQRFLDVDD